MNSKGDLSGELKFINLSDLFQLLGTNGSTGLLNLTNKYTQSQGLIFFKGGNPIDAICGELRGINAVNYLFGWCEGNFNFLEMDIHRKRSINMNRMEIIMAAMAMLDDGRIKRIEPHRNSFGYDENLILKSLPVVKGPAIDYSYMVKESRYHDKDRIVSEGSYGNWIWVILEGEVEVCKETPYGTVPITRLGEGSFIGTFTSLIFTEYSRTATVKAVGETHLGLLDTLRLSNKFASLSPDFRRFLLSLTGRLKKITDRAVDFEEMNNKESGMITDTNGFEEKDLSKRTLYMIENGEMCVMRRSKTENLSLFTLKKDDFFGDVPFIDLGHEPFNAIYMASKNLEVQKLDTENLKRDYDSLHYSFRSIVDNVSECISVTTRLVHEGWRMCQGR